MMPGSSHDFQDDKWGEVEKQDCISVVHKNTHVGGLDFFCRNAKSFRSKLSYNDATHQKTKQNPDINDGAPAEKRRLGLN
jgi:hypothetical protein